MRINVLLAAVLLLAVTACKSSSSPTGPSGGAGATAPVVLRIIADGPFTLSVRGQTFSTSGIYTIDGVPAGAHDMTGQMTQRMTLSFGTPNRGAGHYDVAVGRTTTVLQGPGTVDTSGCFVAFSDPNPSTASTQKSFGIRIELARWESFSQQSPPCAGPS